MDKLQYNSFKSEILWNDRDKFLNKDYVYNSLNNNNLFIHPIKKVLIWIWDTDIYKKTNKNSKSSKVVRDSIQLEPGVRW
jgi:hypothetical protein